MDFEWDEDKRLKVIRDRGVDFLDAILIFEREVDTRLDTRAEYGEIREISIGLVDGACFVVVHTQRGTTTRVITAWKGGRREQAQYQARYPAANQTDA